MRHKAFTHIAQEDPLPLTKDAEGVYPKHGSSVGRVEGVKSAHTQRPADGRWEHGCAWGDTGRSGQWSVVVRDEGGSVGGGV